MCVEEMDVKICLIGKGIVGTSFLKLLNDKKTEFKEFFDFNFILSIIFYLFP